MSIPGLGATEYIVSIYSVSCRSGLLTGIYSSSNSRESYIIFSIYSVSADYKLTTDTSCNSSSTTGVDVAEVRVRDRACIYLV